MLTLFASRIVTKDKNITLLVKTINYRNRADGLIHFYKSSQ